jgi:hypothetical protein
MSERPFTTRLGWVLAVGMAVGWALQPGRGSLLHAGGGDRPDAALVATGPIATEMHPTLKVAVTTDAVYYLNYSRGYLYAAVPMPTQTAGSSRLLSDFGERDLIKDFGLRPGSDPHFTMTSGVLGSASGGWAPLYVFETTTGQMAAYRVVPQVRAGSSSPVLQLLEKRADPRLARARPTATAAAR